MMDEYPEHLAPEFSDTGRVATPFEEWWLRVQENFPTVPEEVARYWLHEHWSHSPFGYIASRDYAFVKVEWESTRLWEIRSNWCRFSNDNADCVKQGAYLETLDRYRTSVYMREHGTFPSPIIVLDNRDGHYTPPNVPNDWKALPQAYVLMEGHRRFNLALHLQRTGCLNPTVPIWLMERVNRIANPPPNPLP